MARPRLVPLKPKTEVDGIRVERVVSVAPSMLIYDGTDTASDDRVVLREYFPAAIATRSAGGSDVEPSGASEKDAFEAGLSAFADHGRALYPFRHKNVVALRALIEANGTGYLVSDHVDGAPLDDLLEPGDALVLDEVEEILPGLLDGLAALHHVRLVHRGLSPAAILIRRDGTPILDLPLPASGTDDVAPPSLAPYIPADWQAEGSGVRGDVYSFGATLYRLVTGEEPKLATERAARAGAGEPDRETARLAALGGGWPRPLRDAIARCLAPAPDARPASVSALRDLLAEGATPDVAAQSAPPASGPKAAAVEPDPDPGPSEDEAPSPPTEPRRGRAPAEAKTQPSTGVEREDDRSPRVPDEVSTVWLGSGGGSPTELPRRRTERPVVRSNPTEPREPSARTRGRARTERPEAAEPSFRRKATPAPPDRDDGPPTVRLERTAKPSGRASRDEDSQPPTRRIARSEVAARPAADDEDQPATVRVERSVAPQTPPAPDLTPEEPPTVPFRRVSGPPDDEAKSPEEAGGVIYRKGRATPVREPTRPPLFGPVAQGSERTVPSGGAGKAQADGSGGDTVKSGEAPAAIEGGPSGAPVVPVGLNLVAPPCLPARTWQDLCVYLHDPGLASLVARHIQDNPPPGTKTAAEPLEGQNLIVAPGTRLTLVPSVEGGRANPASVALGWHETFHRVDFRLAADRGAAPDSGLVRVFLGPILLAEARLDLSGKAEDEPVRSAARGYKAPFFSYVASDTAVTGPLEAAAAHLRSPATLKAMKRRDAKWDRDVLPLIEAADGLFLFWSAEASRSPELRKEWEFALELRGPEFIRLISWVDPMPAPPIELEAVPIIRLDPAQLRVAK